MLMRMAAAFWNRLGATLPVAYSSPASALANKLSHSDLTPAVVRGVGGLALARFGFNSSGVVPPARASAVIRAGC